MSRQKVIPVACAYRKTGRNQCKENGEKFMRILYLCTYYHRAMVFRDSMNYLEKLGHEVTAFNAVAKGTTVDKKYQVIMDEKVVHQECFRFADRYLYFLKQKKIEKKLCSKMNISSFDVMHSHTLFNGGWVALQLNKKYGIPYVVSVRNTDLNAFLKYKIFKDIARKIVKNASAVMFLSEPYKNKFLNKCYSEEEQEQINKKCYVIPNGLEPFWLQNISAARNGIHTPLELLCVGKIDQNKNMEATVAVLNRLIEKGVNAHLTVIGQVIDEGVLDSLKAEAHVTVIPYLKKEQLIEHYKASDIFIMPSFKETFGRVYAEAMSQGMPVIYTRGQGFDETFSDGYIGYAVNPRSIEEITESVIKIIEQYPILSKRCVESCLVFNWEKIAEELQTMYLRATKQQ